MPNMIPVDGNTYPVKDKLKAIGARWEPNRKCWMIDEKKAMEARKIVAGAPAKAPLTPYTGVCDKCKGPVKAPYTTCYTCKYPESASSDKGYSKTQGQRDAPTKRCWECGRTFTYRDAKANDGDWNDDYCGC